MDEDKGYDEEAKKRMTKELASIFAALGTQDFEEVIRALQRAEKIVGVYKPKLVNTRVLLLRDAEKLKADLVKAVAARGRRNSTRMFGRRLSVRIRL